MLEANDYVDGPATSFTDEAGVAYDISAMQGVAFVGDLLAGEPETVWIARGG